ncbi:MAG: hypothetical protein V1676_03120 [Candidatus Diapherotrites archaeon]
MAGNLTQNITGLLKTAHIFRIALFWGGQNGRNWQQPIRAPTEWRKMNLNKVIAGEVYKCRKSAEIPQIPLFEAF